MGMQVDQARRDDGAGDVAGFLADEAGPGPRDAAVAEGDILDRVDAPRGVDDGPPCNTRSNAMLFGLA